MTFSPQISIVMPSYQQVAYLEEAARSVLDQEGVDVELLVMDPGSTDGSRELLQSLKEVYGERLLLHFAPDKGQADAINRGLELARGEILGWLNSDDRLLPGALRTVVAHLAKTEPSWLYGRCGIIDETGHQIFRSIVWYKNIRGRRFSFYKLLTEDFIPQMATFWNRSLWRAAGGLDVNRHLDMDYDLFLRFARLAEPVVLPEYLADFRVHGHAKSTRRVSEHLRAAFSTVKEHAAVHGLRGRWCLVLHRIYAARTRLVYSLIKPGALIVGPVATPRSQEGAMPRPEGGTAFPVESALKPLVSIIILNWNGLRHLPDCLDSLAAQTFRDFEVVLVDNGSEDGSVSFVTERYPWVKVIPLGENTGFASGNNHGLTHSRGDYIVTLNNDTRAERDWLETLVEVANDLPDVGMVGCRICSFSDPDIIDSLGMSICADGMSRGRYRNKRWSTLRLREVEEILFPSACAALYKRAMIEETGLFDDDFFAYAEDSDLGLRGRLAGWRAVLATNAVVYHKYSQTSGSFSPFKVYLVERNHYWVALKNFPVGLLLLLPWFTALRYFEQSRAILLAKGTGGEFRASGSKKVIIKALLQGIIKSLLGMPRMFRKRGRLMKKRRLPMREFSELLRRHRITFKELLDND